MTSTTINSSAISKHLKVLLPLIACAMMTLSSGADAQTAKGSFQIGDLSQWKISGVKSTKLQVQIRDGNLILHWPGGSGQAIIEHRNSVAIKPFLHDGFIRYQGKINILADEYGSELGVQLLPIGNDGKSGRPYYVRWPHYGGQGGTVVMNERLYAPPGEWAHFDCNYKVPGSITSVKPRFVLQGNAITVAIHQVGVTTGLTWKRGRPKAQPEARAFDEEHVQQILAKRQRAVPRLERKEGRVALVVNGKDIFPACYTRGLFYPQHTRYAAFKKAGYNLIRLSASFDPLSPTHKEGIGNMWKAKDTFDFSELEHELKVIANINPNALVILGVRISPYHAWASENPESIVTNEKGQKLVEYAGERMDYGGIPDHTSSSEAAYAPSFYGGQFPEDAANAIKHLAEFLQTSSVGKIVIGIEATGGNDNQLYPWDRDVARGADYSPAAVAAWHQFLRDRYENDVNKLRAAWENVTVTFKDANVATLIDRGYGKSTFVTQSGIDYNDFISDSMADFLLGLGEAVKEGSDNRLLFGAYYSDSGERGVISHGAMKRMMTSPYFDMVRSVMVYQTSGSWWRHSKLLWAELDMRPPMPNQMQYFTKGLDYSWDYFETLAWRCAATALTDWRGGFYPFDLAESWFNDPKMIEVYGRVRAGLESCIDDTVNIPATVGVFSNEEVPFHLKGTLGYRLTITSSRGLFYALDRSGVTYARYLMDDALDPTFTLPKICILRLPMLMTAEKAKLLQDKARRSGSILIWGYAPGALTKAIGHVSGFNAQPTGELRDHLIVMQNVGSLTAGIANKFLGTPPPPINLNDRLRWNGEPYVIQREDGDVVLGKYEGTDQAGAVMRQHNGLTQIILGRPGAISPQFIRNVTRQVGVTPFSNANDEMRFGSGILAFYSKRGGSRTITLPPGMKIVASPTATHYTSTENGFTFQAGYSSIAVFKIGHQ